MKGYPQILHLEDNEDDSELVRAILDEEKIKYNYKLVKTKNDFESSLDQKEFNLIISDFSLPSYDGLTALKMARLKAPDIPFIFVSGTIGEENAIKSLINGATDYVLKHNLNRLPSAVKRAFREYEEKRERDEIEKTLIENEQKYRRLFQAANDAIVIFNNETFWECNNKTLELFRCGKDDFIDKPPYMFSPAMQPGEIPSLELALEKIDLALKGIEQRFEWVHERKDGTLFFAETSLNKLNIKNKDFVQAIIRDITDWKKAEESLKESEEIFRNLFDNSTVGIYRSTPDGKFIKANKAFLDLLGYSSFDELVKADKKIDILYADKNERKKFKEVMEKKGKVYGFESRLTRKDGEIVLTKDSVITVKDNNGNTIFYDGTIEDITKQKKAEQAIINAKEKAEQSEKLKTEFLQQMSHEIRTPINVILNLMQLIKEDMEVEHDSELCENFSIIDSASKRIMRTIDLILNMSMLQSNSYTTSEKIVDIYNEVLVRIYNEFRKIAQEKKIRLTLSNRLNNKVIPIDEYSVTQIFYNIVDNAIKYTNEGRIEIIAENDDQNNTVIYVNDTGIGIDKNYLEKIFDPFSQEESGYTRRYDGTGLGLALVKKYCELNNAEIEINSKKSKGTSVKITFIKSSE
ncbi:MAG: PAS domain S-box protein [Ignavibacteria bacterium]